MNDKELLALAVKADLCDEHGIVNYEYGYLEEILAYGRLVEAAKQADIEMLYALYKQACEQRDMLMDQQRAQIAAMRGQIQ